MQEALIYGLIAGSVYALVALGFGLIFSTVRFFNFAHGAVLTAGAYLNYTLFNLLRFRAWISWPLSVCLAALLGTTFEWLVFRPLRRKHSDSLLLLIASLGLLISCQGIVALIFGNDTKVVRGPWVNEGVAVFGARITSIQFAIVLVSLVLFLSTAAVLRWTKTGIALRAVADDPELAATKGLNSQKIIYVSYLLGSALGAVAGIMISLDVNMNPTMGFNVLLYGMVAVVVGGLGNQLGAYVGGLMLGVSQNLGVWFLRPEWEDAIALGVLLFFLLIKPTGIFGRRVYKAEV